MLVVICRAEQRLEGLLFNVHADNAPHRLDLLGTRRFMVPCNPSRRVTTVAQPVVSWALLLRCQRLCELAMQAQ